MKNFKKLLAVVAVVGVLGATGVVYAAENQKPADIVSDLTGKTVQEVTEERAAGKTYGTIASEADKLVEFKAEMLAAKKAILDQRVKDGVITQAEADEIYKALEENMANCDGTGNAGIGKKYGAGFGMGGNGQGQGRGAGKGMGCGRGMINR